MNLAATEGKTYRSPRRLLFFLFRFFLVSRIAQEIFVIHPPTALSELRAKKDAVDNRGERAKRRRRKKKKFLQRQRQIKRDNNGGMRSRQISREMSDLKLVRDWTL